MPVVSKRRPVVFHRGGGGVVVPYVGPADLTGWSSPTSWWGLRAVSAAYATALSPIADLVDQLGGNGTPINAKADGTMDVAAVAAWVAAHSVTTIKLTKLYDQTGNGRHATQATLGLMPVLALNTIGVRPGLQYTAANGTRLTATSPGLSQPFTFSGVAERTGAFTNTATIFGDTNIQLAFAPSVAAFQMFSGNLAPQTAANDSIFHAFSVAWNDTSGAGTSTLYTSTDNIAASSSRSMASPGTLNMSGACVIGENTLTGFQNELGVWSGDLSANYAAMDTNQRAYWGF